MAELPNINPNSNTNKPQSKTPSNNASPSLKETEERLTLLEVHAETIAKINKLLNGANVDFSKITPEEHKGLEELITKSNIFNPEETRKALLAIGMAIQAAKNKAAPASASTTKETTRSTETTNSTDKWKFSDIIAAAQLVLMQLSDKYEKTLKELQANLKDLREKMDIVNRAAGKYNEMAKARNNDGPINKEEHDAMLKQLKDDVEKTGIKDAWPKFEALMQKVNPQFGKWPAPQFQSDKKTNVHNLSTAATALTNEGKALNDKASEESTRSQSFIQSQNMLWDILSNLTAAVARSAQGFLGKISG